MEELYQALVSFDRFTGLIDNKEKGRVHVSEYYIKHTYDMNMATNVYSF